MIIHIDPGTAFGTFKRHETTQLCMRQLKIRDTGNGASDVGTEVASFPSFL